MTPHSLERIAAPLRKAIGGHMRLLGQGTPTEVYQRARADSDLAEAQARYLIRHLANRQDAALLAKLIGIRVSPNSSL